MMNEKLINLKARRILFGAEIACSISARTLAMFTGDAVEALICSAQIHHIACEVAKIEAAATGL